MQPLSQDFQHRRSTERPLKSAHTKVRLEDSPRVIPSSFASRIRHIVRRPKRRNGFKITRSCLPMMNNKNDLHHILAISQTICSSTNIPADYGLCEHNLMELISNGEYAHHQTFYEVKGSLNLWKNAWGFNCQTSCGLFVANCYACSSKEEATIPTKASWWLSSIQQSSWFSSWQSIPHVLEHRLYPRIVRRTYIRFLAHLSGYPLVRRSSDLD